MSESGKSTFLKHLKIASGGLSDADKKLHKKAIYKSTLVSVQATLQQLAPDAELENPENKVITFSSYLFTKRHFQDI